MHDLTWALATGKEYLIPIRESTGSIFMGRVPSFVPEISAPIKDKGSTILSIGLVERESSPIKVEPKSCADNIPEHNLIEVPEFPKSKEEIGFSSPFNPLPSTK